MVLLGKFVKELGGQYFAISLALLAFILSPAYLHTNALFQPVAFNHFYWIFSCYLFFKLIDTGKTRYWLYIAVVFGLGFMNKYSIVFLFTAFGLALLASRYRNLYRSSHFLWACLIAIIIIMPNIIWQYDNNWPVLYHMEELRRTQLIHISSLGFLKEQLLMNAHVLLLWIATLITLLFYNKESRYRIFGSVFLITVLLILSGSGKSYYTLGVYPMLFAFGAFFVEKYVQKYIRPLFVILVLFMGIGLYISLSFDGIPFLSFEKALNKGAFRWEDGQQYDLPQDMADMTGWREIGETVKELYLDLATSGMEKCEIFTNHYGQGGAVMFYGKAVNIPQPISATGSFIFWSPDQLTAEYVIYVHSDLGNSTEPDSLLPPMFDKVELKKTIDNPYFRENGTRIYLCQDPNDTARERYSQLIKELRRPFTR